MNSKKLWKGYFWLLLLLNGMSIYGYVIARKGALAAGISVGSELKLFHFVISIMGLVGVYGFAFSKGIYSKNIWRGVLFALIASLLFGLYDTITSDISISQFTASSLALVILFMLLYLPQYLALFLYGWKSDLLWDSI